MRSSLTPLLLVTVIGAILLALRPMGPLLIGIALVIVCMILAIHDLTRRQDPRVLTSDEYYTQFEPKSKVSIGLTFLAIGLFYGGWLLGAFADPNRPPTTAVLALDIVITVFGFTFWAYARRKSESGFQTLLTWVPLCFWFLHSIVLLGHGITIERVEG